MAAAFKTEAGARDVAPNRDDSIGKWAVAAKEAEERALDSGFGLAIIGAAHERIYATIGALQIAREQLHADEPRGTGQQHPVRRQVSVRGLRREGERRPGASAGLAQVPSRPGYRVNSSLVVWCSDTQRVYPRRPQRQTLDHQKTTTV